MTATTDRANPFEALDTFQSKPQPKPVDKDRIVKLAEDSGFPSRPATPARKNEPTASAPVRRKGRRFTTGRNQQINIKATSETIDRLYRVADRLKVPLGEAL